MFRYIGRMTTSYSLQVSETIHAPAAKVFQIVNDLKQFEHWNPFLAMDPATDYQISPNPSGEGATYSWQSKRMGKGSMVFTSVIPNKSIAIEMTFTSPNQETAHSDWILYSKGDATEITWTMTGQRTFLMSLMVKVLRMDKMMSKHFLDGLGRLKAYVEKK